MDQTRKDHDLRHDERRDCTEARKVAALERIAHELAQIEDTLLVIGRHLIGGLSPEEVEATRAEARDAQKKLKASREELMAAIRSQTKLNP